MRAIAAAMPEWQWHPQRIKPGYLLLDEGSARQDAGNAIRCLRHALRAARIARPFVNPLISDAPPPLPEELADASLNQVVAYVLDTEGDETADTHNIEQRQFRRFLPVLHLALALEQVLGRMAARIGAAPPLEVVMSDAEALGFALGTAQALEPKVCEIGRFKVRPETQIRLRLLGSTPPTPC